MTNENAPTGDPQPVREAWVQWDPKGYPIDAVKTKETADSPTIQKGEWVRMVEAPQGAPSPAPAGMIPPREPFSFKGADFVEASKP